MDILSAIYEYPWAGESFAPRGDSSWPAVLFPSSSLSLSTHVQVAGHLRRDADRPLVGLLATGRRGDAGGAGTVPEGVLLDALEEVLRSGKRAVGVGLEVRIVRRIRVEGRACPTRALAGLKAVEALASELEVLQRQEVRVRAIGDQAAGIAGQSSRCEGWDRADVLESLRATALGRDVDRVQRCGAIAEEARDLVLVVPEDLQERVQLGAERVEAGEQRRQRVVEDALEGGKPLLRGGNRLQEAPEESLEMRSERLR